MKAELEIEILHEKIDQLREQEVLKLTEAVMRLTMLLDRATNETPPARLGLRAVADQSHNDRL